VVEHLLRRFHPARGEPSQSEIRAFPLFSRQRDAMLGRGKSLLELIQERSVVRWAGRLIHTRFCGGYKLPESDIAGKQ